MIPMDPLNRERQFSLRSDQPAPPAQLFILHQRRVAGIWHLNHLIAVVGVR